MSLAAPATPFPFIHTSAKRRKNTWYTIGSGNWTDPNIWMCNALTPISNLPNQYPGQGSPTYVFPRVGDDVYIGLGHTVTCNTPASLNNLYVAGSLLFDAVPRVITLAGDIQATGSVNMSNAAHILNLQGVNNFINTFISGTSSTVNYNRVNGDQPIMDLNYFSLSINNGGTKYLTNNLNVAGNITMATGSPFLQNTLELSVYNLTVQGTTTTTSAGNGILSKTGSGNILFVGVAQFQANSATCGISLTGNPTVELRGGMSLSVGNTFVTGTSLWSFTTNSQQFFSGQIYQFNCPISVVGAIALSVTNTGGMSLNAPIDCTVVGGSVINRATIYFNSTSSLPSFTTGTFDRTSFANTVGYTMPGSITLPYTNYSSLYITNTGTKTISGDTLLLGGLTISGTTTPAPILELATFNLTVNGATNVSISGLKGNLSKTGGGSVLFIGKFTGRDSSSTIFSGNPTVEFRGGIDLYTTTLSNTNFGTGAISFTTNSQSVTSLTGVVEATFGGITTISGAITLTVNANVRLKFNSINGNNASSTLTNKGIIALASTTVPMTTGVFDYLTFSSIIEYNFNGDYTLPYLSYQSLTIMGTGTKTLSGNTTLSGNLLIADNPSVPKLELSTFDLTVNGTTSVSNSINSFPYYGGLSKTGAGNLLFVGSFTARDNSTVSLSGNPALEFRGGLNFVNSGGTSVWNFGNGNMAFTTNNQSIINLFTTSLAQITFNNTVTISGAITVTCSTPTNLTLVFLGTLNGNNAASTFDNRGTTYYQNAQQPMLTGILQVNAAANTFMYNASADQNITGGTYRTLTLAGSGVKTLQGNVVVATAYTLTAPATLNLNGFTRT